MSECGFGMAIAREPSTSATAPKTKPFLLADAELGGQSSGYLGSSFCLIGPFEGKKWETRSTKGVAQAGSLRS